MKMFMVALLIAAAAAAPQKFKGDFAPNFNQNFGQSNQQKFDNNSPQDIVLLNLSFDQDDDGNYKYEYEQSNGQKVEEVGRVQRGPEPETGSLEQQGSFEFVAPNGKTFKLVYIANENGGFQAEGDHLPTPPPQIPEYEQLRQNNPELFWAEQGGAGPNQQKFGRSGGEFFF